MEALELIMLGRQLTKIGEEAMRGGHAPPLPAGHALVLRDVLAHPGSSVTDITGRTGLAQSIVSKAIARFQGQGIVEVETDPADGRRTLARVSAGHLGDVRHKGAVPADAALAAALGEPDPAAVAELISGLEALADRLRPGGSGLVARQLRRERATGDAGEGYRN
ncbi:MAG TPA: helix-turn-helix domain-containing protein [Trebonia sp.]|jgi:DNA-binding transcriptional ArsR family regulator